MSSEFDLDYTLRMAAKGDAKAWRALVEAYSQRVFALIYSQCRNQELAEEITQATFVKIVTQLANYSEQGRFEPWLFRIAMNNLRDEMRRQKRQAKTIDMRSGDSDESSGPVWASIEDKVVSSDGTRRTGASWSDGDAGDGEDPAIKALRAEQLGKLRLAVSQMNEADQQIILLRHTAGLSFAEIATTLGEPLGTVLARGHRALEKLRKIMEVKD
jgi:RNA polymerase sigma-70 factor, ECF subfamily